METLDPISAWAQSVNWNAWEAVGTVGAVFFAVWAGGQASRDARRREVARAEALLTMAIGVRDIVLGNLRKIDEGASAKNLANRLHSLRVYESALAGIDRLELSLLPSQRLVDRFMVVRAHAHLSAEYVREIATGGSEGTGLRKHLQFGVEQLSNSIAEIAHERDLIKRPFLGRFKRPFKPSAETTSPAPDTPPIADARSPDSSG